jgi:hypothetical protein
MDSSYSDLWLQAIKEVLAEDGKPPLSAAEEDQVRSDVEQMNAARDIQFAQPPRFETNVANSITPEVC